MSRIIPYTPAETAAMPSALPSPAPLGQTSDTKANALDLGSCLISASDLEKMQVPKRTHLLDRWLCAGDLGYIFAPRGVGKTWMAMALPRAISQGKALGIWQPGERPNRVLYVDGEMPLELTQYRSRGLSLGEGDVTYLHHETLFDTLGTSLNIGNEEHRATITALIEGKGFECVILDNLSSLAFGIDENKGSDYEPIAHWLLDLRRRKITVIVIHHAGRNNQMRGHSKREDACSWILELQNAKNDDEPGAKFISHFAKATRNTGEPMPDLLWHFTTDAQGHASIHCELSAVTEYETFIRHVLEGADRQADIAEMMNKPKGTISKWTTTAVQKKRIRREGNKLLPPTATGERKHRPDVDD